MRLTPLPPPGGPGGGGGGFAEGCLGFEFCGGGGGGATVGLLGPPELGRAAAGFEVGGGGGGGPDFRIELVEEDGLALGVNDGVEFYKNKKKILLNHIFSLSYSDSI